VAFGTEELEGEDLVFTGLAAADGSMKYMRPVRARRAGWGNVAVKENGELRFAFFGVCPDRCPTAHRAEIWAILHILRRAVFPLTLLTDHMSAVNMYKRGREYCCDSARYAADLWRSVWQLIDQNGGPDGFELLWVKGHATAAAIAAGWTTARFANMNKLADEFADQGMEQARAMVPNDEQVQAYERATAFYGVLKRLCSSWPEDYLQVRAKAAPRGPRRKTGLLVHPLHPHEPWRFLESQRQAGGAPIQVPTGRCECALCRRSTMSGSEQAVAAFVRSACLAGRAGLEGLKGAAREAIRERRRRELQEAGAVKLEVRCSAQPPATSGPPRTQVFFAASFLDARASTMKPKTGCRVGVNAQAGAINLIGPTGQAMRLLSGVRGRACTTNCVGNRCVVDDILTFVMNTHRDATRLSDAVGAMAALPALPAPYLSTAPS